MIILDTNVVNAVAVFELKKPEISGTYGQPLGSIETRTLRSERRLPGRLAAVTRVPFGDKKELSQLH